jgi:hypothetical protein
VVNNTELIPDEPTFVMDIRHVANYASACDGINPMFPYGQYHYHTAYGDGLLRLLSPEEWKGGFSDVPHHIPQ